MLSNEYEILSIRRNLNNKLFNTIPRFITVTGYIIVYVIYYEMMIISVMLGEDLIKYSVTKLAALHGIIFLQEQFPFL